MAKTIRVERRIDWINALPDEMLCHILSFLPTDSAVCASVLSKRWRYLHTQISSIDISINQELSFFKPEKFSQIKNFVVRDSLSRRSIPRFRLEWDRSCGPFRVKKWMGALMCRNIQELELCIEDKSMGYYNVLPASLFSCETLVVLKLVSGVVLSDCSLKIPAKVSLPNLKVLHIRQTGILDGELEKLLSSCPVLDDLVLEQVFTDKSCVPCKLNISNATLRRLAIHSLSPSRAVKVVINCPALEYLSFFLLKDQSLVLLAKQCLAEVVIGSLPWPLPGKYDVFRKISNVKSLQILGYSLQGIYKCEVDLPLFKNLNYLKLSDSMFHFDPRCLEYLLGQCVVLKTLVFELHYWIGWTEMRNGIKYDALKPSRLVGLLCHLKTVKIQLLSIEGAKVEDLLKFFKFFLRNAKILEELTIRIEDLPNTQELKMRTELLTTPRVSKKCKVVLNDEKVTDSIKSQYNNIRAIKSNKKPFVRLELY